MIIVLHSTAPKALDAISGWRWSRASKEYGIARGRGGSVPLGEPRNVRVAGIHKGFVACLHFLNQLGLLGVRVARCSKLRWSCHQSWAKVGNRSKTYHDLDIILVTNRAIGGTKGNSAIGRVRRPKSVQCYVCRPAF